MDEKIWPLAGLRVMTPRLVLSYVTDDIACELARLAATGIHDRSTMPFATPWTDVDSPELERNTLRHFWRRRAEATCHRWGLDLAVVVDEATVGVCSVDTTDFGVRRSAETGSWIGRHHQGRGHGKETREALLHLIFAGFHAQHATTRVWHDNAASLAITRSLPYTESGSSLQPRRDRRDLLLDFAMSRRQWQTNHRNDIHLIGIEAALDQLHSPAGPYEPDGKASSA